MAQEADEVGHFFGIQIRLQLQKNLSGNPHTEGEIEDHDFGVARDICAGLGLGDFAAFGLTREDIRDML